jgi:plasmid stabilization system protein ParE
MPRLIWSRRSVEDLVRIKAFLDHHDSHAALRVVEAIRSAADFLSGFPGAGPAVGPELRSFRVRSTPYLLLYSVQVELRIARVRQEREDWRSE